MKNGIKSMQFDVLVANMFQLRRQGASYSSPADAHFLLSDVAWYEQFVVSGSLIEQSIVAGIFASIDYDTELMVTVPPMFEIAYDKIVWAFRNEMRHNENGTACTSLWNVFQFLGSKDWMPPEWDEIMDVRMVPYNIVFALFDLVENQRIFRQARLADLVDLP